MKAGWTLFYELELTKAYAYFYKMLTLLQNLPLMSTLVESMNGKTNLVNTALYYQHMLMNERLMSFKHTWNVAFKMVQDEVYLFQNMR